jgi:hypothetical protein
MVTLRPFRIAVACIATLAAGHRANAQFRDAFGPNTRGFFFKFSGAWTSLRADSINTRADDGLGTTIGIGVGFTSYIALAFDGGGAFYRRGAIDHYHVDYFDAGLRLHYPRNDHRIVPYGDLMFAGHFLRIDSTAAANGPVGTSLARTRDVDCGGWTAGAGLLYFVTSKVAIDGSAHLTLGDFKTTTPASPYMPTLALPARALRVNVGLAFYPDSKFRWPPRFTPGGG